MELDAHVSLMKQLIPYMQQPGSRETPDEWMGLGMQEKAAGPTGSSGRLQSNEELIHEQVTAFHKTRDNLTLWKGASGDDGKRAAFHLKWMLPIACETHGSLFTPMGVARDSK